MNNKKWFPYGEIQKNAFYPFEIKTTANGSPKIDTSSSVKSHQKAEPSQQKTNSSNDFENAFITSGDETKNVYYKSLREGKEESKRKGISEKEEKNFVDNYVKKELSADNNLSLYNNAAINMAKIESKSGKADKETEKLAELESEDIPMSEYIKSKDESDYKKGKFSTIHYASSNSSEYVKNIQQLFNKHGLTDKFGDKLDEDGLLGAQTYSAMQKVLKNTKSDEQVKKIAKDIIGYAENGIDFTDAFIKDNYTTPTKKGSLNIFKNKPSTKVTKALEKITPYLNSAKETLDYFDIAIDVADVISTVYDDYKDDDNRINKETYKSLWDKLSFTATKKPMFIKSTKMSFSLKHFYQHGAIFLKILCMTSKVLRK